MEKPQMEIIIPDGQEGDGPLLIRITGTIDLKTFEQFRDRLKPIIKWRSIKLDFEGITLIDSQGLWVLREFIKIARDHNLEIKIVKSSHAVDRVLKIVIPGDRAIEDLIPDELIRGKRHATRAHY